MSANSYRLSDGKDVDGADIAALLAELRDVGGAVEARSTSAPSARPLSGQTVRRGVVGGTNVLTEQQRSGTVASTFGLHRRTSGGAPSSATAAAGALAPIGFSTYDAAEAAQLEAQFQQQQQQQNSTTPLGVRLTPLASTAAAAGTRSSGGGAAVLSVPSPTKRPHPPPPRPPQTPESPPAARAPATAAGSASGQRPSLSGPAALPPLPSLPKPAPPLPVLPGPPTATTQKRASADLSGGGGAAAGAIATAAADTDAAPREINFLPVMCARYLRPVGLIPAARWGHTLTPITGDTMLLFGGVDVHGAETASLMAFNPVTIAWEPLYTAPDAPVARHSHAACAYDGRYLVISGGVAQQGGRVLDDVHLYDTYTHRWRCVWSGERDGSPQNRNEPGPRFGHSVVLHEDRLYLYGGKTVPPSTDMVGRRRSSSSTATSPAKLAGAAAPSASPLAGATAATTAAATMVSGSDVCVFSLNSFRWRRRLHQARGRRSSSTSAGPGEGVAPETDTAEAGEAAMALAARPAPRAYHAACVRGTTMFVNGGGAGSGAEVLTDTWAVDLTSGVWRCIHRGGTADAVPREKHALFVCGEALLLVGGCSGGGGLHERITGKFTNFAVVLPLVGAAVEAPCWIPVAMGNLSIVSPAKKSFAAALTGGFVYVFGGVCGAEPATSSMIRFLAADGCVSQNDQAAQATGGSAGAGAQQLRWMLQQLRDQQRGTPYDAYAYAGTYGSVADIAAAVGQLPAAWAGAAAGDEGLRGGREVDGAKAAVTATHTPFFADRVHGVDGAVTGLHRALVQQRSPLLWAELERCRSDTVALPGTSGGAASGGTPQKHGGDEDGDEVDALLRAVGGDSSSGGGGRSPQNSRGGNAAGEVPDSRSAGATHSAPDGLPVYYTNGTARVAGLTHPLSPEALQCLIDYVYWGGLKGKYRVLLEEDRDNGEEGGDGSGARKRDTDASFSAEYRSQLAQTLERVREAAATYQLGPLAELCAGLLAGSREDVRVARQHATEQLQADLAGLLGASASANTTMLVVDPHTTAKAAHVLHSSVLMAASGLFTELLRPLYRASAGLAGSTGSKASNQVGSLAAKLSAAAAQSPTTLLTATSKRTVLIGPVPLPLPAVRPILRYLYTQELRVSGGLAFEVMLGAHQLGLTELQALCEAVVAREEVNYQTCCTFYYLARKYQASLLEESALLTAVSGFAEVRFTAAYQSLSEEERQNIDAVASELGSSTWVPPQQTAQEVKSKATYAARWNSSAPL